VEFDPAALPPNGMYKLLISSVVPRPIAWVSSVDAAGVRNLAPFSYFMAITDDPPTIAFSCSYRGAGADGRKDTLRNVEATREFVVNVVDDERAAQMNVTSGDYPPEVDEFQVAGLSVAPGARVKAPRVSDAPIAMECRLDRIVPVGRANLVLGRIVYVHVREGLYDPATGRVDMHRLRPVGRLSGNLYTHVHDIFEMKRPNPDYRG
jgi:flavin reductase (DIM6/NTAB) family NADH-FMN oxidoreductase RutF